MGVIFCIIMGLIMMLEPICDNDFFWHNVVGKWVLDNKMIPNKELFSWYGNYPWVAHEWLTETIMAIIGNVGALIIMVLIFLLTYLLIAKILRLNWKKIFDFKLIYFLMLTVFFKVTGPRPYILSLLFFTYLIYVLFNYVDNEKNNKLVYSIVFLQIIWVNFHGGSSSMPYIFIIGILLSHLFSKLIPINIGRLTKTNLSKKQVKTLIIVLILTILATFINPFGVEMLKYPFTNMLDGSMTNYITEWLSPSFHNFFGIYIFILIAFPLFNMILTKKRMQIHEVAFQLLLLYMALKSQRFIGMYAIYSTWNLGKYFFLDDSDYEIILNYFKKYQKIIGIIFSFVLVFLIGLVGYQKISYLSNNLISNDGFYSDEAIKKLIELKPERLYNDYSQGGYLLYKLDQFEALDDVKVFAYGLGDVFSKEILPDTVNLQDLKEDPERILNKYNFDYLITTSKHTLHYYLEASTNYEEIYSDDMCFIFKKI